MLGSHNTLSYLPPVNLWGKMTKPWGKCQDKNIEEQYNSGVRYFDIRVRQIRNVWHIVHNKIDYGNMWLEKHQAIFKYIGEKQVPIRLIYDQRTTPKMYEEYERGCFLGLIAELKKRFNIVIDSAITYWDWREYINESMCFIMEHHASVYAKWYEYILGTKRFAKKHNNKYIAVHMREKLSETDVLLMDYL